MEQRELNGDEIRFQEITRAMFNTYQAKNADYGNSVEKSVEQFGLVACAVRMSDKMNRFNNLIMKEAQVSDESLRDTLLDLANYCIITAIIMDKGGVEDVNHSAQ